jgi:hypothetical protein
MFAIRLHVKTLELALKSAAPFGVFAGLVTMEITVNVCCDWVHML